MHQKLIRWVSALALGLASQLVSATDLRTAALDVDYALEIDKSERSLVIRADGRVVRKFQVALGRGGLGDKRIRGDNKTPLGTYHITEFNEVSPFLLFMRLNYPNVKDGFYGLRSHLIGQAEFQQIIAAARHGETPPQNTDLGGAVGIHGLGEETADKLKVQRHFDWTRGCIALTNEQIIELRRYVEIGTLVTIRE
ncbi:MAG: L,D-transpeptidase [Gammaproteobacteria bacterium]|nr:L,D-transpeptidase [Gammaproteobacteria bacterium]